MINLNNFEFIFKDTCRLENLGSSDLKRTPNAELNDISVTLLARDYKGLGNYSSNGVIEIWRLKK